MQLYTFDVVDYQGDIAQYQSTKRLRDCSYSDIQQVMIAVLGIGFCKNHKMFDRVMEFSPGVIFDNVRFWQGEGLAANELPRLLIRITDSTRNVEEV